MQDGLEGKREKIAKGVHTAREFNDRKGE